MMKDDFVSHYETVIHRYEFIARQVRGIVEQNVNHSIVEKFEDRAKAIDSFARKSQLTNKDKSPKYTDPLNQITDLAAVRVIVFLRSDVEDVCEAIKNILTPYENEDVGERVFSQGRFGYQSIHFLVELDKAVYLPKEKKIKKAICEIQVRTLLQHAWAEMEHDIQYKADFDIPADLKKRFSALAGALEICDREFERIQNDSEELKRKVASQLVSSLTDEHLRDKLAPDHSKEQTFKSVRELIFERRFSEAVALYTTKVDMEPKNYTLLIGRAQAKFLMGDSSGAIADLELAEQKGADSGRLESLKSAIEKGDIEAISAKPRPVDADDLARSSRLAAEALQDGDGVAAFEHFVHAEGLGMSRGVAAFGKAMSCTLEGDFSGAITFINQLKVYPATPMKVNICSLRLIIEAVQGTSSETTLDDVRNSVAEMPEYIYQLSPLRYLLMGMEKREAVPDRVKQLVKILEQAILH